MSLIQYTDKGEPHGLINTLTNSVPFDDFKHFDPKTKAKVEKEMKEDKRMVRVVLLAKKMNDRLEKTYCRYAGEPILQYKLIPGKEYDLPYGFVREVNDKVKVQRSDLLEVDGKPVSRTGAPTEKDSQGEWDFKLVPVNFT